MSDGMKAATFNIGDTVQMRPDTGWRGVIIAKHKGRNNGFKVQTVVPHGPLCADTFSVRPISIAHLGESV
jgi:hypothetical protein